MRRIRRVSARAARFVIRADVIATKVTKPAQPLRIKELSQIGKLLRFTR